MRIRSLVVLMMVGMMLAACSRERATVTGEYGSATLSGQVSMSGTTQSSPSGVRVSVRGTGMATVLGANGEFAFANVPQNAQLDFTRASDNVAASLRVDDDATFLAVELTPTTAARKSSRRHGVGRGSEPVYEFEGTIVSATDAQLVMFTSKKVEQTIGLATETVMRKGNTAATVADLVAGVRVHVKAKKVDDAYVALLVIVQNRNDDDGGDDDNGDDDRPGVREYEGTVRSASATQLVVFTSRQVEETFVIEANTDIRKGNTPVAAADIQAGWRVHVKAGSNADGSVKTALRVTIQNDKGPR